MKVVESFAAVLVVVASPKQVNNHVSCAQEV
jgi:hypothetical protein